MIKHILNIENYPEGRFIGGDVNHVEIYEIIQDILKYLDEPHYHNELIKNEGLQNVKQKLLVNNYTSKHVNYKNLLLPTLKNRTKNNTSILQACRVCEAFYRHKLEVELHE
jgi:hypothetical protein